MITIHHVEVYFDQDKALIAFPVEDVPASLKQVPQLKLRPLKPEHAREARLMLVLEGDGPTGPLVLSIGPMSAGSVKRIHDQTRELTLCVLGTDEISYAFHLSLR